MQIYVPSKDIKEFFKELLNMKDVKFKHTGNTIKIIVDDKEIATANDSKTKIIAENLLISLDQAGAINLSIETEQNSKLSEKNHENGELK